MSASVEASYGGLVSVSGGFSKSDESASLAEEGSHLKISFKVRKVTIQRPWMDPFILQYPILGINGLEAGEWSDGKVDPEANKGAFPLLPTAMIVAKDIEITSKSFSETIFAKSNKMSVDASVKVWFLFTCVILKFLYLYHNIIICSTQVGVGLFSAKGNFSYATGSKSSDYSYDDKSNILKIKGAQIIGWVCVLNPFFPKVDAK